MFFCLFVVFLFCFVVCFFVCLCVFLRGERGKGDGDLGWWGGGGVGMKSSKEALLAIIFNKIKMFAQSVCGTCLTVRPHTTKKRYVRLRMKWNKFAQKVSDLDNTV